MDDPIITAERAKSILNDPLVRGALTTLRSAIVENWATISVDNEAQQLKLKHLMWATQQFENYFEILIGGGDISVAEAKERSRLQQILETTREKVSNFL